MLSLALAATLVGFVLLIVGLITGTVWLAVACIVVCLIGLAFLIVDIIGSGDQPDDEQHKPHKGGRKRQTQHVICLTTPPRADQLCE